VIIFNAIFSISKGENVLVTAHTGAGKTTVAEYGIFHTIKRNKNIVYTSPIKSLSNEKYNDFKNKFSNNDEINLGIMTGDNKINPDGNCIIMTAEILRNILYRKEKQEKQENKVYQIKDEFIENIGCIIMDEVHFINDRERGKVWEETLMLLDSNIQLIMLSATIDKAEEFANWIGLMKEKPINLISTTFRPVPLTHYIYVNDKLYEILDSKESFKNLKYREAFHEYNKIKLEREKSHKREIDMNKILHLVKFLENKNLFQTIFFSFSKRNCEKYANMINYSLVDHEERKQIEKTFMKYMHNYEKEYSKLNQYNEVKKLLSYGVAYHHSGLMPVLKEIIEIIFHKGLIKVLFATETFAVGVNMPTRTVVFTELEKYTNNGKRNLNTAEYKQMSGRAGRRGIDTVGNVILLPLYNFPEETNLKNIMLGRVPSIKSQFDIDYSFYLRAIQTNSVEKFMKRSLFYKECCNISKSIQNKINETKIILHVSESENEKIRNNNNYSKLVELHKLNNLNDNTDEFNSFNVKLSKSQKKRINKLKHLMNNNENKIIYDTYSKYIKIKNDYTKLLTELKYNDDYINYISNNVKNFLLSYNYLDEQNILTRKGIIASRINECNAILLTEIITNNYLNDMTPEEIIGFLAIFLEPITKNEDINIDFIKGTPLLKNKIKLTEELGKELNNYEYNFNITYNEIYWNLSYDFVDNAYNWAKKKSLKEVLQSTEIMYLGNFIRNMIRINNIATNLIELFEINGNIEIIPKLQEIDGLIMRDFVSVNSLYL
jgi:antiviral helicase SKI2